MQNLGAPTYAVTSVLAGLNGVTLNASITNMNGFVVMAVMHGVFESNMTLPTTQNLKQGYFISLFQAVPGQHLPACRANPIRASKLQRKLHVFGPLLKHHLLDVPFRDRRRPVADCADHIRHEPERHNAGYVDDRHQFLAEGSYAARSHPADDWLIDNKHIQHITVISRSPSRVSNCVGIKRRRTGRKGRCRCRGRVCCYCLCFSGTRGAVVGWL